MIQALVARTRRADAAAEHEDYPKRARECHGAVEMTHSFHILIMIMHSSAQDLTSL